MQPGQAAKQQEALGADFNIAFAGPVTNTGRNHADA
jgi:hypothetical protein